MVTLIFAYVSMFNKTRQFLGIFFFIVDFLKALEIFFSYLFVRLRGCLTSCLAFFSRFKPGCLDKKTCTLYLV